MVEVRYGNPEKYVQRNKFRSAPVDRSGEATALYTTETDPARTVGKDVTVWWMLIHNYSGSLATVWLESPSGTPATEKIEIASPDTVMIDIRPLDMGDVDIFVNASADGIGAQIGGIETDP